LPKGVPRKHSLQIVSMAMWCDWSCLYRDSKADAGEEERYKQVDLARLNVAVEGVEKTWTARFGSSLRRAQERRESGENKPCNICAEENGGASVARGSDCCNGGECDHHQVVLVVVLVRNAGVNPRCER
jgi:hypothetical protein